jgi:ferritin-like protein
LQSSATNLKACGRPKQIKVRLLKGEATKTGLLIMPTEIFDIDKFVEISERAEYCAVKRLKDVVKLKLRTPRMLYTLKLDPAMAEEVIKKLRCEVREV